MMILRISIKLYITVLCLWYCRFSCQQLIPLNEKTYADSLKAAVSNNNSNTPKIEALLLLADLYRNSDSTAARNYLNEAKQIKPQSALLEAKALYSEGQFYREHNTQKATEFFEHAISNLQKIKSKEASELLASAWLNAAIAEKNKQGYPYLIEVITQKSIPLLQKIDSPVKLGNMYSQLGIIFTYNADFKNAQKYLDQAIKILEKNAPKSTELFVAYMNSVSNYCYQSRGDEARKTLQKAEKIIAPYPNSSQYSLFYYGKMLTQITKEENTAAFATAEKGVAIAEKNSQAQLAQMFYFNQYDILKKQKNLEGAKKLLEKVLNSKNVMSDMRNRKTVYGEMSTLSEIMGNVPEALQWSRKFSAVSDSLYQSNLDSEIKLLEAKFNDAEHKNKLSQKELEISKKNTWMWIFGFAAMLFLISAIYFYHSFRNRKKLAEQREINLRQELKEKEQTEQLKLTKAILDGEEQERERVAKDLHDGLGGMLAGVKINLSTWSNNHLEENQVESFHKILNQLDSSVTELRRVARNLMPESLLNFGLEIALKDLCEFYMKDDLHIDFQAINIQKNLPVNLQVNIYRIVQELLNNAVKHSNADNILVQCSQNEEEFFITVEDNGKGITEKEINKVKSLGLKNLQNRVEYLRGKMEIQSGNNEGTIINIEVNTGAVA